VGEIEKEKTMEYLNYYIDALKNYAVFSGRTARKNFWMFVLINVIISILVNIVARVTHLYILSSIYSLAVLIPAIAVSFRRMHDTGRPGWWTFIPIINIVYWCEDSAPGANQYGPNPKGA